MPIFLFFFLMIFRPLFSYEEVSTLPIPIEEETKEEDDEIASRDLDRFKDTLYDRNKREIEERERYYERNWHYHSTPYYENYPQSEESYYYYEPRYDR